MPPAIAGTRAITRKLCTGMNGLASANFHTGRYGGMCPQLNLAFFLRRTPTFGRGSSLIQPLPGNKFPALSAIHTVPKPSLREQLLAIENLKKVN